jgi:transposase InsO family protein
MGGGHNLPSFHRGLLVLAFILDACSRKVVGWSMATHLRTELVVDALQMAITRRKPALQGLGTTLTEECSSLRYPSERGLRMRGWYRRWAGDSTYDNALAGSFAAPLKTELLRRSSWPTRQTARTAFLQSTLRAFPQHPQEPLNARNCLKKSRRAINRGLTGRHRGSEETVCSPLQFSNLTS